MSAYSECVKFYKLLPHQCVAISRLAAEALDRDTYLTSRFPFSIGHFTPKIIRLFPVTPFTDNGHAMSTRADHVIQCFPRNEMLENIRRTSQEMVVRVKEINHSITAYQINILEGTANNLTRFAARFMSNTDTIKTQLIFDNHAYDQDLLKAPFWHVDKARFQAFSPEDNTLLPDILTPLKLYLLARIGENNPTNIQTEYIPDHLCTVNGKLHPLVAATLQIELEQQEIMKKVQMDTNGRFTGDTSKWSDVGARIAYLNRKHRKLDQAMRRAGLIRQAKPNEILAMSNYTLHRSAPLPPGTTRSGFLKISFQNG